MSRRISCSTSVKSKSAKGPKKMKRNHRMKNRNITYATILFWLVCFGLPQSAQAAVPTSGTAPVGGNTAKAHAAGLSLVTGRSNTTIGLLSPSSNTDCYFNTRPFAPEQLLTDNSAGKYSHWHRGAFKDAIASLLVIPWLLRGFASTKAIWRALTDGQKSNRKQERFALADS
jgi:hypothetical protein